MFNLYIRCLIVLSFLLLASCANTSISQSWIHNQAQKVYKHPMIIGISDSQQSRQIYEKHFVSELKKNNVTATPSYKLISSKQKITQESIMDAIQGTEIDSVLVSYLVSADSEMIPHDSPVSTSYSGNVENIMISDTLVASRGRSSTTEIIGLKNDFYDVKSKRVVWSIQTTTVAPESIDEVIVDVTKLLIDELFSDEMLE